MNFPGSGVSWPLFHEHPFEGVQSQCGMLTLLNANVSLVTAISRGSLVATSHTCWERLVATIQCCVQLIRPVSSVASALDAISNIGDSCCVHRCTDPWFFVWCHTDPDQRGQIFTEMHCNGRIQVHPKPLSSQYHFQPKTTFIPTHTTPDTHTHTDTETNTHTDTYTHLTHTWHTNTHTQQQHMEHLPSQAAPTPLPQTHGMKVVWDESGLDESGFGWKWSWDESDWQDSIAFTWRGQCSYVLLMIDSWALQTTTQRAQRHPHSTSSQGSRAGGATQHHPRQTPRRDFRCVIRNVESHAMMRNSFFLAEMGKTRRHGSRPV